MRGLERALGLSRQTFSRWLVEYILALPPLSPVDLARARR